MLGSPISCQSNRGDHTIELTSFHTGIPRFVLVCEKMVVGGTCQTSCVKLHLRDKRTRNGRETHRDYEKKGTGRPDKFSNLWAEIP